MDLLISSLQQSSTLLITLVFLLGLMVGSFLNVVIVRLPATMLYNWRRECREFLELAAEDETPPPGIVFPASHCPQCQTPIKPWHNLPLLSFLILKGRCHHCAQPISLRYPLIEALSGICSALVAWRFGFSAATVFALLLTWGLIALSFIDIDRQLLPDAITQPLLWLGLVLSLFSVYCDSRASIIGAAAGYLSLWSVYKLFKLLTGKEGMGYGDFKLLALFGAWLGWQFLPMIILLSSLVGALFGIALVLLVKHDAQKPIPFGPYLAAAGWLALLWGQQINHFYLRWAGW